MKFLPVILCLLVSGCSYVKVVFQNVPDTAYANSEAREAVLRSLDAGGVARWREANRRIVKAIRADHPNPWFRMSRESFLAQVAALDQDLPKLSEYQVVLRWKRILAAFGDGHTQLWEEASWLRVWPIRAAFSGDRLVIRSVANGQEAWLGARILEVGGEPVGTYLGRLEAFIVDPVPSKRRERLAASFTPGWAWLEALGVLPTQATPELLLETMDGRRVTARLELAPWASLHWKSQPAGKLLLRDLELQRNYAFRILQEGRTLYLRYRSCRDEEAEPMGAFVDRVARACVGLPLERILLDLRGNGGGSEWVSEPLLSWVRKHPVFSRPAGTIVLTDAGTYSSGHGLARRLKGAGAQTAGAETGQPENAFGQVHFTVLPGLKPALGCSLRRFLWDKENPAAWRRGLLPDLPLEPTTEDVLGLSDTVLDRVLTRPFPGGAKP